MALLEAEPGRSMDNCRSLIGQCKERADAGGWRQPGAGGRRLELFIIHSDQKFSSVLPMAEDVEEVVLVDGGGRLLAADGSDSREGADVAAIQLRRPDGSSR